MSVGASKPRSKATYSEFGSGDGQLSEPRIAKRFPVPRGEEL